MQKNQILKILRCALYSASVSMPLIRKMASQKRIRMVKKSYIYQLSIMYKQKPGVSGTKGHGSGGHFELKVHSLIFKIKFDTLHKKDITSEI